MNKQEFEKLLKEAENGNANAMYLVGIEYELGKVVELDLQEAAAWMNAAAELGHEEAKAWLDDYYFDDDANVQARS